jgi:hypothetical protein
MYNNGFNNLYYIVILNIYKLLLYGSSATVSLLCVVKASDLDKRVPVTMARCIFRMWMEERPPIGRVAANILNKQSRRADTGWSSSLGVGRGANNSLP